MIQILLISVENFLTLSLKWVFRFKLEKFQISWANWTAPDWWRYCFRSYPFHWNVHTSSTSKSHRQSPCVYMVSGDRTSYVVTEHPRTRRSWFQFDCAYVKFDNVFWACVEMAIAAICAGLLSDFTLCEWCISNSVYL